MREPSLVKAALLLLASLFTATRIFGAQAARADAERALRIGAPDGDEPYLFARVSGAVRLSSGVVVVANYGSSELRWFSPGGRWIRSRGRQGDGPGEFRSLRRILRLPGDSILAADDLTARLTLFDSSGTLVRSWSIAEAAPNVRPLPLGRLADGSFIAMAARSVTSPPGYTRQQMTLLRYREGSLMDRLFVQPGGEFFSVGCGTRTSPGVCAVGVPYGLRSLAAAAGPFVFAGNGERYEVVRYDSRSRRVDTLRREVRATPLAAARRAFFVDSVASTVPAQRRGMVRQRLAEAPIRQAMPFFEDLVTDDRGGLWVARPQERLAGTRAWDVFSAEGRFVRSVSLPASLAVTSIAGGFAIGVSRDADGVEYVEAWRVL